MPIDWHRQEKIIARWDRELLLESIGVLLIRWTVRVSLLLYFAVLAGSLAARDKSRWTPMARWLWSGACAAFVAHVFCVFHFYHHWSHAHAVAHTAERTLAQMGFSFGAGVFFSYAFTLLWIADCVWWWLAAAAYERRAPWLHRGIHAYLFFIAFNGAVVFETGVTRWAGLAGCLVLLVLAARRRNVLRRETNVPQSFSESHA